MTAVDPRKVTDRRELKFSSMQEILDDVEYLDAGDPPRATGNWTSAQIVRHVAVNIAGSIDGFPFRAPLPLRLIGGLLRKRVLTQPMKPGVVLPPKFAAVLVPPGDADWADSVDLLRRQIGRLQTAIMTRAHPVFGRLTHDQWVQLHCRHAEMHFSFMHPS